MLAAPAPDADMVMDLLTIAARVPDHGAIVPFRFVVLGDGARARLHELTLRLGADQGRDSDILPKQAAAFGDAPLSVAVITHIKANARVPVIEQEQCAAAVCLSLVNACHAAGFGAHWLTSWMARDTAFLDQGLGLSPPDTVAGFIHIGTPVKRPSDRPRPDVAALTTWIDT
jgi:nitroreductase